MAFMSWVVVALPPTRAPPTPVAATVAPCWLPSYVKGPPVTLTVGIALLMM